MKAKLEPLLPELSLLRLSQWGKIYLVGFKSEILSDAYVYITMLNPQKGETYKEQYKRFWKRCWHLSGDYDFDLVYSLGMISHMPTEHIYLNRETLEPDTKIKALF